MNAIELSNVSKIYRRYGGRQFSTLKSALLQRSLLRDLQPSETFPALTGVTFNVPKGSTYGVIGRNGSGKSTALKLVAGITKPTSGTVRVEGRISALIELGAGFHPEISGRENVFINGIMLGLTKREIQERFDEIVDFAELREFIDAPVKTYSSGMYMRLGFAVAIHVNPDVLLVDEVLAVGDEGFTHKCLDKFAEFRRRGKTILLVTHSLNLVERFCDEALWLDAGRALSHGDPKRVVGAYLTRVEEGETQLLAQTTAKAVEDAGRDEQQGRDGQEGEQRPADPTSDMNQATEGRWGSREVEITEVALLDGSGQPSFVFQRRSDVHSSESQGGASNRRLRLRHRLVQRRRRLLLRYEHLPGGNGSGSARGRGGRDLYGRESGSGRRHLQAGRRRAQTRRLPLRLSPPALHLQSEITHARRRHLQAASSMELFTSRAVHASRLKLI